MIHGDTMRIIFIVALFSLTKTPLYSARSRSSCRILRGLGGMAVILKKRIYGHIRHEQCLLAPSWSVRPSGFCRKHRRRDGIATDLLVFGLKTVLHPRILMTNAIFGSACTWKLPCSRATFLARLRASNSFLKYFLYCKRRYTCKQQHQAEARQFDCGVAVLSTFATSP